MEIYRKTHGMTGTPTYFSWGSMIQRCLNPKAVVYQKYGGKGILVCEDWKKFENFYRDMGDRPEGTSLDRIDVNGNYCKENCRWADRKTQAFNQKQERRNKSGRTGVIWHKKAKKWMASIAVDRKSIYLGLFENFEDAVKAREDAELKYYGAVKK